MRKIALRMPKLYLFSCWLCIGLAGALLGFGPGLTSLFILIFGYFANIIWMMRES